jgi:putative SOS response-associated peptidase YedK
MINARAETVGTKLAFRASYHHRRCLIPADGFYEWKPLDRGKQPHYIRMRDGEVFAFAGLWERWQGEEGKLIESCAALSGGADDRLPDQPPREQPQER